MYVCNQQLIFRKVSDMKREKELAERRKNEPQHDHSQDHLVRKIFSRFRKAGSHSSTSNLFTNVATSNLSNSSPAGGGTSSQGQSNGPSSTTSKDVEKGELIKLDDGTNTSPRHSIKSTKEDDGSRTSSAKSKWGRLLRNSPCSDQAESSNNDPLSSQSLLPKTSNTSKNGGDNNKFGSGNKVYPKLSRVPERQESVEEPERGRSNKNVAVEVNAAAKLKEDATTAVAVGTRSKSEESGDSSMLNSFLDLKNQVQNEVQRINHKMSRMEGILGEILTRLTPPVQNHPSPSVHIATSGSIGSSSSNSGAKKAKSAAAASSSTCLLTPAASSFQMVSETHSDRQSPPPRTSQEDGHSRSRRSKNRPKSAASQSQTEKITTHFKEYV